MREDVLLTDTLKPATEPYAIAKIPGIKLFKSYNRQTLPGDPSNAKEDFVWLCRCRDAGKLTAKE